MAGVAPGGVIAPVGFGGGDLDPDEFGHGEDENVVDGGAGGAFACFLAAKEPEAGRWVLVYL